MRKVGLLLRGAIPLLLVAGALVGLPALAAWAIMGGGFGWQHLLIGLGVGAGIFAIGSLILGWALGRRIGR